MLENSTPEMDKLIDQLLNHPDVVVRRNAAINICKVPHSNNAIEALIKALNDHEDVAIFAMLALVEIGKDATPSLLKALKSKSEQIRGYAVEILGEIKADQALDDIIRILKNDESLWVRNSAVAAIQRFHSKKTIDILTELLKSEDNWLVVSSCVALNKMGYNGPGVPGGGILDFLLSRLESQKEEDGNITAWGIIEVAGKKDIPTLNKIMEQNPAQPYQKQINEIIKGINSR